MHKRSRWLLHSRTGAASALLLTLAGLVSTCITGCHKTEATPVTEVSVQVAKPHLGSIVETISADATLSPLAQAAISPKVTAPVKKFLVQRGAHVKIGQLLATLENSDLAASALDNEGSYAAAKAGYETATQSTVPEAYTRAQLDLAQARANLDLNQNIVTSRTQLFAQGAIPGRDLDTAKAALVQAQAAYDIAQQHLAAASKVGNQASLDAAKGELTSAKGKYLGAQAQLSYTEIRSPIDGVVTERPLFAGETAAAGAPLITVMDVSALIAKVHVAQMQAQQIKLGATAELTVQGIADPIDGTVSLISPALDPGSTTVEVWVRIDNRRGDLKAGTPVHVEIAARTVDKALIVPNEAVQAGSSGEGPAYFVLLAGSDGAAHKRAITLGIRSDKETQAIKGITANDTVITSGGYGLDEGTKIKVGTADGKPAAGGDDK